ncbi:MAG: SGNH/GDSL hydrolase family protein [Candidatus Pacebacteria bacterium]|nr:SGNH/GDSL hydrolase family protein [Candidatus Paceibacterota bacterium]
MAEAVLRIFAPAWLTRRMEELNAGPYQWFDSDGNLPVRIADDEVIGFIPLSKARIDFYEYANNVSFDEFGGRVTTAGENKKSFIIPFLGDSMLFGLGVDDGQTYLSLLGSKSSVRYLNLGIPGSCLAQEIDIIKYRHKDLGSPPLYVFNFFTGNDFSDLVNYYKKNKGLTEENRPWISPYPFENFLREVNRYFYHNHILKKSFSVQFFRNQVLYLYNRMCHGQFKDPVFLVMDKNNKDYLSLVRNYLNLQLERLNDLSRELNFKFIFIIIPDRHQVYPDLLKLKIPYYGIKEADIDVELPNRMLKDSLGGIPYIDLLGCLKYRGESLYYIQDNHFTVKGNEAAAECIYPELKKYLYEIGRIDIGN